MKRYGFWCGSIALTALALMVLASPLAAGPVDDAADSSFAKLTEQFSKKYPAAGMKRGLSVLPFKEESELARAKGLGSAIREVLSQSALKSQVFYLIDRDTLERRMKEVEVGMTGLVDEKTAVAAGRQAGVQVFVAGSIAEVGDAFQVSVKLIDVETGEVAAQDMISVPAERLVEKQREIAFGYIAKHGIGINIQTSYMFMFQTAIDSIAVVNDVYVSYRPALWLNFKLGVTNLYVELVDEGTRPVTQLFPNATIATVDNYAGVVDVAPPSEYPGGKLQTTAPTVGVEYNYMLSEKFVIAAGISITPFVLGPLVLEQRYSTALVKLRDFSDSTDNAQVQNTMIIKQTFDPTVMIRFELRPQYFISPRATVGLLLSYAYTPPLIVRNTDFGDGYTLYPHDSKGAKDPADRRFGFDPLRLGLGNNVEDDFSLSGLTLGVSLSFYF
jgi:TolB-like protein